MPYPRTLWGGRHWTTLPPVSRLPRQGPTALHLCGRVEGPRRSPIAWLQHAVQLTLSTGPSAAILRYALLLTHRQSQSQLPGVEKSHCGKGTRFPHPPTGRSLRPPAGNELFRKAPVHILNLNPQVAGFEPPEGSSAPSDKIHKFCTERLPCRIEHWGI